MATIFKNLTPEDMANTRTLLYEQIPITGTIASGTYSASVGGELNIFNYSHDMFQTVYDYPFLSSSANDLFDITFGAASASFLTNNKANFITRKNSIYNQMAKVLAGHDSTGSIRRFDYDGLLDANGVKISSGYFLSFSRLLTKDEIRKGTFRLTLGLGQESANRFALTGTVYDHSGTLNPPSYLANSPVGDCGILYLSESINDTTNFPSAQAREQCGLIFYQAGVVFLSSQLFARYQAGVNEITNMSGSSNGQLNTGCVFNVGATNYSGIHQLTHTASITNICDAFRRRLNNVQFQNTTELNSTIYFLRINNNEFNYSSNPTYLSSSVIRVKDNRETSQPRSYITTAGLYSANNELMAVAKLSQPLKKTPEDSLILRVRLDY